MNRKNALNVTAITSCLVALAAVVLTTVAALRTPPNEAIHPSIRWLKHLAAGAPKPSPPYEDVRARIIEEYQAATANTVSIIDDMPYSIKMQQRLSDAASAELAVNPYNVTAHEDLFVHCLSINVNSSAHYHASRAVALGSKMKLAHDYLAKHPNPPPQP